MDKITDVVVIGFGAAGSAAAIEAADAGAKVLVLEKMRKPGGALFMSAGLVYAAGTSVQRAAGIKDTPDEAYQYFLAGDSCVKDPALVRVMADKSGEVIEWLIEMGADFPPEELAMSGAEREYASITPPKPRCHHFRARSGRPRHTGHSLFGVLEEAVNARKIEIMLETAAIELVKSAKNEVVGVKARSQGSDLVVHARRGIILADGGFAQNPEMIKQFLSFGPYVADGRIARTSHPGQTGDGIRMAMAVGAGLCGMAASHATPRPFVLPARYPSMFVNREGRRFVNESRPNTILSDMLDRQDSIAFQIFDDGVMKEARIPEARANRLVSAPTISELARRMKISAGQLESTVELWNRHADVGEDPEFGRTGPSVRPLRNSPYWGGQLVRMLNVTYGGLKTNEDAQVLEALHNRPIPRLYAAGQTTGGRFGTFYPGSGNALADSFVFGRIAGQKAAAEIPLEECL